MSLHAAPSPETIRQIQAQRRATTLTSLIAALLLIVLIGVVLFIISLAVRPVHHPPIQLRSQTPNTDQPLKKPVVEISRPQKPVPPGASSASRIISLPSPSDLVVPVTFTPQSDFNYGENESFGLGTAGGFAKGSDQSFTNIPTRPGQRCSPEERLQRVAEYGGTPECEAAVLKALRYLAKHQSPDGSWGEKHPVGITALALLAYLGHCETPLSEEFGETVYQATHYLVANGVKNEGRLASDFTGHWSYEHAIATYALSESYLFSKSFGYHVVELEETTERAVQWIIDHQNEIGGWNYQYEEKARWDTSINAWHLQALKAAQTSGLGFRGLDRAIQRGLEALAQTQQDHGGFGYSKNGPSQKSNGHYALTGAGVLCFQQHKSSRNSIVRKGLAYLQNHWSFDFKKGANLYEHYYVSQAAMQAGGQVWKSYNQLFRDQLLEHQRSDGSWPSPVGNHYSAGVVYNTCLATLMLEVYYRYLPGTGK